MNRGGRATITDEYETSALAPAAQSTSIDMAAVLATMLRERKFIFICTLATFAAATLLGLVLPAHYTSEVAFIPPSTNSSSSVAAAIAGQLSSSMGAGDLLGGASKTNADLYSGILKSRSVLSEIVKKFDLVNLYGVKKESAAEKQLSGNSLVAVEPKSSIVTLNVTAKSPALAHDIAAAYVEALHETEGRLALTQSSQRRLFFQQQLAKEKDALEDAEVDLKKTEEQSGLIAPSGQTETQIRTMAATQAQIASRQVALSALLQSATDENPQVIRLRSEIQNLQAQLARFENSSEKGTPLAIPTSRVPEVQLEYVRRAREVKYHETLFEMIAKQYEAARMDESRDAPVLQVLDPPSYPDARSGPKRLYFMLGGFFLGFLGASVWVLTRTGVHAFVHDVRSTSGRNPAISG